MKIQYTPYIWFLLISVIITLLLAIYAFTKQRHSKCAICFTISMIMVTIWSGFNALEMSTSSFYPKLFFANMQYIAYCYSPLTLLALCMQFTGYDKYLKNKKYFLLLILPTICFVLVWLDPYLGLMRNHFYMNYMYDFPIISKNYGPMFYVHSLYEHSINITVIILLIRSFYNRKTVYRKQAVLLLIGVSFIVFPNLFYITGLSPVREFDFTPVFFAPAGILMTWSIFRYKMFDLVPIARTTVIETMESGVMILDIKNRIVDMNPALEKILQINANKMAGHKIEECSGNIPEFSKLDNNINSIHFEFTKNDTEVTKIFNADFSPLKNQKGVTIGKLLIVYDITEQKKENERRVAQERFLAIANEKERMARDLHDNLAQVLGFINLQAQGVRQELISNDISVVDDKLDTLIHVTQNAHEEIRTYIKNACELSNGCLSESLIKAVQNFEELSGLHVNVTWNCTVSEIALHPQVQLQILNIIKESLNNILKHANANRVNLSLLYITNKLTISVEDDGQGFNFTNDDLLSSKSFGLKFINQRAKEIGAKFILRSAPGAGCCITLEIPIFKGDEEDA